MGKVIAGTGLIVDPATHPLVIPASAAQTIRFAGGLPTEQTASPPDVSLRQDDDIAVRVKHFLHGLMQLTPTEKAYYAAVREKNARDRAVYQQAYATAYAISTRHGALTPDRNAAKKVKKMKPPTYVDETGAKRTGFPDGAYLRVRTHDEMVEVIEHRPSKKKSGDWSQSIKWYGPFVNPHEQRAFMCRLYESVTPPGPRLDAALDQVRAWRRYDEP